MWILNLFYDIFSFSEDTLQNDLLINLDSLRQELNNNNLEVREIPELHIEWLPAVLERYSIISILNKNDWDEISADLSTTFSKHIPDIVINNYDFLKEEEDKILKSYFVDLEKKVTNIVDFNNYCITGNLINILELIENTNLQNHKKTVNHDFLKYIKSDKYNQSSQFFKDHLIRSLSVDEDDPNTTEPSEINKWKKYINRKSLIEGFLKKHKLF